MDENITMHGLDFSIDRVRLPRLARWTPQFWLPVLLIVWLAGCSDTAPNADLMKIADKESFFQIELASIRNERFPLSRIKDRAATVFVFLDGDCPICQRYAPILNQIHADYQSQDILIVGVFPEPIDQQFSGRAYHREFGIDFGLYADPELRVTHSLSATITPEVIVVDGRGEIRYRGAISNWFLGPGEKRAQVTEHYLRDALDQFVRGAEIEVTRSQPVGCYIL